MPKINFEEARVANDYRILNCFHKDISSPDEAEARLQNALAYGYLLYSSQDKGKTNSYINIHLKTKDETGLSDERHNETLIKINGLNNIEIINYIQNTLESDFVFIISIPLLSPAAAQLAALQKEEAKNIVSQYAADQLFNEHRQSLPKGVGKRIGFFVDNPYILRLLNKAAEAGARKGEEKVKEKYPNLFERLTAPVDVSALDRFINEGTEEEPAQKKQKR